MPRGVYERVKPIWVDGVRVPKALLLNPEFCKCGCGKMAGAGKKFILGHNAIGTHINLGKSSWNRGLTKEVDERVRINAERTSKSLKGKHFPHSFSRNSVPWIKGLTKETDERVKLIAEKVSLAKKGKTPKNIMENCIFCDTKPEIEMKRCLNELGISYEFQFPVWEIEHRYVADFYLPLYNLIIEVDGKGWHNYPDGKEIDRIRMKELEEKGYRVLRFWENEFDSNKVRGEI